MKNLLQRLRRYVFNALALGSLLLCLGTVAIWADSYRGLRMVETVHGARLVKWASRDGVAVIRWDGPADGQFFFQRPTQRWQVLGLSYTDGRLVRRKPWGMVILPYWMPGLLTMALPLAWVVARHRSEDTPPIRGAGASPSHA